MKSQIITLMALVLGSVTLVINTSIRIAQEKLFWTDEGYEITATCAMSTKELIFTGAGAQCSQQPFYYLLQKAVISTLWPIDASILVSYRWVSILSAALLIGMVTAGLGWMIGFVSALACLFSFFSQPIFLHYTAENRPYMLWLSLLCTGLIASAYWTVASPFYRKIFGCTAAMTALLLSVTAGPGFLQAGAFISVAAFGLRSYLRNRKFLAALGTTLILCTGLGYFYARQSCSSYDAGEFDLLKTGNLNLVAGVVRLLIPKGSVVTLFLNVLMGLGLLYGLRSLWHKRETSPSERFSANLSLQLCSQLLVAILIGVLVAARHYYFIQRVFIFLVPLRALAIGVGTYWLISASIQLQRRLPTPLYRTLRLGVIGTLAITATYNAQNSIQKHFPSNIQKMPTPFSARTWIMYGPTQGNAEYPLNNVVNAQKYLQLRGGLSAQEFGYVIAKGPEPKDLSTAPTPPGPSWNPITHCGRIVEILGDQE